MYRSRKGSEVNPYIAGRVLKIMKKIQDRETRERVFKELASDRMMKILAEDGFRAARTEALTLLKKQKG